MAHGALRMANGIRKEGEAERAPGVRERHGGCVAPCREDAARGRTVHRGERTPPAAKGCKASYWNPNALHGLLRMPMPAPTPEQSPARGRASEVRGRWRGACDQDTRHILHPYPAAAYGQPKHGEISNAFHCSGEGDGGFCGAQDGTAREAWGVDGIAGCDRRRRSAGAA